MPQDWKIYRTRFVVRAMKLTEPFSFTDSYGREHHGRAGDYLVKSSDGLRISLREIFEDVYVILEPEASVPSRSPSHVQPLSERVNLPV
jgi:hypothetical protein